MSLWARRLAGAGRVRARRCGHPYEVRRRLRHWYCQDLGAMLAEEEARQVARELPTLFGYHLLQLGCLTPELDLSASCIRHQITLDLAPGSERLGAGLLADPARLPIASDSVDVIILPHTLEMDEDPHQVLREAKRVLVGEGHAIILCFNPWSLWGVRRRLWCRRGQTPWCARFISPMRMKDWLEVLGFEIVKVRTFFHRPPLGRRNLLNHLQFMEKYGPKLWPAFGAVMLFVARKRVVPLTPVRPRWQRRRRLLAPGLVETRQ